MKFSKTHLQKELNEARKSSERNPNTWIGYERMGRILHWMNDASSVEYFKKALQYYPVDKSIKKQIPPMKVGNFYRMAGEPEIAHNYFERAYVMLKKAGDPNEPAEVFYHPLPELIAACFVLRKYEEAIAYGRILQKDETDPNLFAYKFMRLAEAKVANDVAGAERLVDELAINLTKGLKLGQGKIQDTGGITAFDLYELALEMLDEMKAESAKEVKTID